MKNFWNLRRSMSRSQKEEKRRKREEGEEKDCRRIESVVGFR